MRPDGLFTRVRLEGLAALCLLGQYLVPLQVGEPHATRRFLDVGTDGRGLYTHDVLVRRDLERLFGQRSLRHDDERRLVGKLLLGGRADADYLWTDDLQAHQFGIARLYFHGHLIALLAIVAATAQGS